MSYTTKNFGLTVPTLLDPADISQLADNWKKIDDKMFDGEVKTLTSVDDLNTITTPGFYRWDDNNRPKNAPTEANMQNMKVIRGFNEYNAVQEICCVSHYNIASNQGCALRRAIYYWNNDSKVSAWEWINPPLNQDVEYRTTERYKNESVFVTLGNDGIIHKRTESGLDITPITYGTTDLTAGTSELTTGQLYFVYE